MRSKNILRATMVVLAICVGRVFSLGQEAKIKDKDVPAAVLNAFRSAYPNATVRGLAREKENGKVFYEIESTDGATKRDLLYNPDGTVAEIEETVTINDLPSAAQALIHKQHPKAVVSRAEKVTAGDKVKYEVSAREGKRRISLAFDAEGNILNKAN